MVNNIYVSDAQLRDMAMDIHKGVDIGPTVRFSSALKLMRDAIRSVDRVDYEFVHMPVPTAVEDSWEITIEGAPVRYVSQYDAVCDEMYERLDFYAKKK